MDIKRKLFFMIISLFLFIFFIKQKNETNYEVYYEIKIISNFEYILHDDIPDKLIMEGII